jgi:hypothetical protein
MPKKIERVECLGKGFEDEVDKINLLEDADVEGKHVIFVDGKPQLTYGSLINNFQKDIDNFRDPENSLTEEELKNPINIYAKVRNIDDEGDL